MATVNMAMETNFFDCVEQIAYDTMATVNMATEKTFPLYICVLTV